MTHFIQKLLHLMLSHPGHQHFFELHIQRDAVGNVKPVWRCLFLTCGYEEEATEWDS